ncbi:MAG TPA: ACT domain-containing protein [Mucilaginibacter sp.]|nr:ACT domain-containing protein [Mucilaginibacter sp.]
MSGETNITSLLKNMIPKLNEGEYVFCVVKSLNDVSQDEIIGSFKEEEGITVILKKETADSLNLSYSYIAAWITLTVHSSLEAVGLTAAFSAALAKHGISCNVVAAYYHDHIFVAQKDAEKAMLVLGELADKS